MDPRQRALKARYVWVIVTDYPFFLHSTMAIPWDASTDGTLRSHTCIMVTEDGDASIDSETLMCEQCGNIRFSITFRDLERRAVNEDLHRTRNHDTFLTHLQLKARKDYAVKVADRWRLEYSKSKSRLASALSKIDDSHRVFELLAKGAVSRECGSRRRRRRLIDSGLLSLTREIW